MRNHCSNNREGVVLVTALVCLLIVMTLVATMLKGALGAQRQLHVQRDARQTELLLQAGADRAALRLTIESDYRGESWEVPSETFDERGKALVMIKTSRESEQSPWQVRVLAEYPAGSEWSIRRSLAFTLPASNPQAQE